MNELTDLEICKKISLIELNEQFPEAKSIEFDDRQNCFWVEGIGFTGWPLLEPLTDDALCLQLIDKHDVSINTHFLNPDEKYCYITRSFNRQMFTGEAFSVSEFGLKKAACLAIIESKE